MSRYTVSVFFFMFADWPIPLSPEQAVDIGPCTRAVTRSGSQCNVNAHVSFLIFGHLIRLLLFFSADSVGERSSRATPERDEQIESNVITSFSFIKNDENFFTGSPGYFSRFRPILLVYT